MTETPFMPKATAVWLVENTTLTFKQIAEFCNLHELEIKGMSVGAAEVSDKHGNFIINHGGAKAADVIELIRRIRAKVESESGYILEPEVLLVGQSWDDVLS